jgi:cytochrome c peroxidase
MHVLVVHFPIALLLLAPAFVLLATVFPLWARWASWTALLLLVAGTAGAVVAVKTGLAAQAVANGPEEMFDVMARHRAMGELIRNVFLVLTPLYGLFVLLPCLANRLVNRIYLAPVNFVFLVTLAAATLPLANTAHLGGRLVHEFGVRAAVAAAVDVAKEKPGEKLVKPEVAAATPAEAKPEAKPVTPAEESTKPEVKPVKPAEESTKPEAKPVKPAEESTKPEAKPVKPAEESTKPEAKPVKPAEESTKPEVKPVKPAEESTKPEVKPGTPAGGIAHTQVKPAEKSAAVLPTVPAGLPPLVVPEDNPITPEKVELGRLLYFDKRVSKDGTVSCATCHDPQMAWAEHTPTSEGIGHQKGGRNAPTVINAAYATSQFWDGRAKTLEEQATGPVENPIEMGGKMEAVVDDLAKVPDYQERFQRVFGTGVSKEGFAKAIAAFERTVLSGDSPYDRFVQGEQSALTAAQKRGWETFRSNCASCHRPPLFSNYLFFNAGVGMDRPSPDEGRKKITGKDGDLGKFRVPALRDVAQTHPYFHDGSAATLADAVALMAGGGKDNPNLSEMFKSIGDAKISQQDESDLVEFLKALSGKYPVIEPPAPPK